MVEHDLRRRGIRDQHVLAAMLRVPRHEFVPEPWTRQAYADAPLPIGVGQTISQPYIVALMTEALRISGGERVLELGTGSGYQTAILAEMGADVWTVERSTTLLEAARDRLGALGYERVHLVEGDGTLGLPSCAPFDRILATGSLPAIHERLVGQLVEGGILVAPVGRRSEQHLLRLTVDRAGSNEEDLGPCRFVPLIGAAGWPEVDSRHAADAKGEHRERREDAGDRSSK